MTQAERIQEIHDTVIRLDLAINGNNGVEGLASKVKRHDRLYWKMKGVVAFITFMISLSAGTNIYLIFFH